MLEDCKTNIVKHMNAADESDLKFLKNIETTLERHFALKSIYKEEQQEQLKSVF